MKLDLASNRGILMVGQQGIPLGMPIMDERGQSTAEYALMVFWVMLALIATFKLVQEAIAFFCRYVISVIGLPVP
jgi:hypothetical protein